MGRTLLGRPRILTEHWGVLLMQAIDEYEITVDQNGGIRTLDSDSNQSVMLRPRVHRAIIEALQEAAEEGVRKARIAEMALELHQLEKFSSVA